MKKIILFSALITLALAAGCAKNDPFLDEVEIAENEEDIPMAPWRSVARFGPGKKMLGTPRYYLYVTDKNGNDLLSKDSGSAFLEGLSVYNTVYGNLPDPERHVYYDSEMERYTLPLMLVPGATDTIRWSDGTQDIINPREEYNKAKTLFRYYLIFNGEKTYNPFLTLTK